jgi:hypothetical protein
MTQSQFGHQSNSEVQQMEGVAALLAQSPSAPGVAKTGTLYGLGVTQQTTANGTVLVGVGAGVVQGSLTAGASLLINDAAFTLDIFTANPMGGLPRYDIVVFDALTRSVTAIIGSPNATPTDPTVPATSLALARLRHNASDTTITAGQIDDLRTYTALAGAPIPVPNQAARDALTATAYTGMRVLRLDLGGAIESYSGGAWRLGHRTAGFAATTPTFDGTVLFRDVTVDITTAGFTTAPAVATGLTGGPSFASSAPAATGWVTSVTSTSVTVRVKTSSALSNGSTVGVYIVCSGY